MYGQNSEKALLGGGAVAPPAPPPPPPSGYTLVLKHDYKYLHFCWVFFGGGGALLSILRWGLDWLARSVCPGSKMRFLWIEYPSRADHIYRPIYFIIKCTIPSCNNDQEQIKLLHVTIDFRKIVMSVVIWAKFGLTPGITRLRSTIRFNFSSFHIFNKTMQMSKPVFNVLQNVPHFLSKSTLSLVLCFSRPAQCSVF